MTTDYVPIEDRVRVVDLADHDVPNPHTLTHAAQVLAGGHWRYISLAGNSASLSVLADDLRNTIRDACEAVRERCAEAAFETVSNDDGTECLDTLAKIVAAAIRGLEL